MNYWLLNNLITKWFFEILIEDEIVKITSNYIIFRRENNYVIRSCPFGHHKIYQLKKIWKKFKIKLQFCSIVYLDTGLIKLPLIIPRGYLFISTGQKFATTHTDWIDSANLNADDGVAGTTNDANATDQASGFDLSAANGTINGITYRIEGKANVAGEKQLQVSLSWDGGTSFTAVQTTTTFGISYEIKTLGGATDTWGRTWAVSELTAANFRAKAVKVGAPGGSIDVDYMTIEVDYTPVITFIPQIIII